MTCDECGSPTVNGECVLASCDGTDESDESADESADESDSSP